MDQDFRKAIFGIHVSSTWTYYSCVSWTWCKLLSQKDFLTVLPHFLCSWLLLLPFVIIFKINQYLAEDLVKFIVCATVLLNLSNGKVLFLIDFGCFSIDSETQPLLEKELCALIVFTSQNEICNFRGVFLRTVTDSIKKMDIKTQICYMSKIIDCHCFTEATLYNDSKAKNLYQYFAKWNHNCLNLHRYANL